MIGKLWPEEKKTPEDLTIVKKYANRRLYDTGRSSYVTLDDLCEMVKEGYNFMVQDAKTGEDITRSVLTQIIVEQESRGQNLLPTSFLRNLIGFYGDNIQEIVPNYLESTLDTFVKNQEKLSSQINKSIEGMASGSMDSMFPGVPTTLEEMNKRNMEMFERTMKMFSPFGGMMSENDGSQKQERIEELERTIKELQDELRRISRA